MRTNVTKFFSLICILISTNLSNAQSIDSLIFSPNPVTDKGFFQFKVIKPDTITLEVYNNVGSIVMSYFKNTFLPKGEYKIEFDGALLPAGMYISTFSGKSIGSKSIKIINQIGVSGIPAPMLPSAFYDMENGLLNFPDELYKKIEIFNAAGILAKEIEGAEKSIPISGIPSGVYLYQVQNDHGDIIYQGTFVRPSL